MPDHGMHCPFLNRTDERCSDFFSLDRLDYAFGYCFGKYRECRTYREMLAERQVRRVTGRAGPAERVDGNSPLIQVTLQGRQRAAAADRYHQHAA